MLRNEPGDRVARLGRDRVREESGHRAGMAGKGVDR